MADEDDYNFHEDEDDTDDGIFTIQPGEVLYPAPPDGYGEQHPPAGGFSMAPAALITASEHFDAQAEGLASARSLIETGYGKVWIFGMADTLYTAGSMHMDVNRTLYRATQDGEYMLTQIANGLVEVANKTEGTDVVTGAAFKRLDIH